MDNNAVLDTQSALSAMGGDGRLYQQTVSLFLEVLPRLLGEMNTAFNNGDRCMVRHVAHTIKSSSRTIGGMMLGDAAECIEAQCDAVDDATLTATLKEVNRLFSETYQKLTELK